MELPNDVLGERGADAARLSLKPYKRAACQVEEASIQTDIIDLSASCQLLHDEIAILARSAYKRLKKLKRGWNTLVDFNQDVSLLQTALCN